MGFIAWLIMGALVGAIASVVMKRDAQLGIFIDIAIGIVGAVIASWALAPWLGTGTVNDRITPASLLVSMLGAAVLLAIIHPLTRNRTK